MLPLLQWQVARLMQSSFHPTKSRPEIATKMYTAVVISIEASSARGMILEAFFVSSAMLAIFSNPKYAKNIKPAALIINIKADSGVAAGVSKKSMLMPGLNSSPASIIANRPKS
jgi:hypothetical protein